MELLVPDPLSLELLDSDPDPQMNADVQMNADPQMNADQQMNAD